MFRKTLLLLAVAAMTFGTTAAHATCPYGGGNNRGYSNYNRVNYNRGYNNVNRGYAPHHRGYNNVYRGSNFGYGNYNRGYNNFNRNVGWGGGYGFGGVRASSNFIGIGPIAVGW